MDDGRFGPWTVEGPNLNLSEANLLQDGEVVEIIWSGGNGPHRYRIVVDRERRYAVSVHQDSEGPMRFYNPIGDFIGDHPRTQIRKVRK